MLSLRTFFILSILLVDVSAQVFKCFDKCDDQEEYVLDKIACMGTCPIEELRECKKRCNEKWWLAREACLVGMPMTCLAF